MKALRNTVIAMLPLVMLGACTGLSEQDRAMIASASQNAQQAKDMAQQALAAAQAAQSSASQAEKDAQAANEKADRIFQRSLRKTSP
jgi:hypothetical protein